MSLCAGQECPQIVSRAGARCSKCAKLRRVEKQKVWRAANPERSRELRRKANKAWYARNTNKALGQIQARHKANPRHFILLSARSRAKRRNIPFTINLNDIVIPTHCPYLGIELVVREKENREESPSLDRINPELGYVPGNVEVISKRANALKNGATLAFNIKVVARQRAAFKQVELY